VGGFEVVVVIGWLVCVGSAYSAKRNAKCKLQMKIN